nr:hypothetical protein B0A51_16693 [Rachicladosporium sp. CCFEE 5018]
MSIIERNSPLNLQYKVCIVTNASSPLGVVICKTLLKANALVLGVDDKVRDHSLNAGLGTHFQFEQVDIHAPNAADRVIDSAKRKFEGLGGGGRVDALINLLAEDAASDGKGKDVEGFKKLSLANGEVMKEGNGGSIVVVPSSAKGGRGSEALVELTRDLSQQHVGSQVPPEHYTIANLVLFLAGGMSEDVTGRRVNLDGAHCAL